MAGEPVVSLISREIVVPAKPTQRQSYFLSCFDIPWKDVPYISSVLFYESSKGVLSGEDDWPLVMEKLKSSLTRCLVHYYPWCGRLSPGDRLFIDCNDAGVEFVEASLDLPISLLSHQGFPIKPFFEQLCQKVDHSGYCLYSSPLLSIQATRFSDGGLALGITLSHLVVDGQAFWNFMVSWGECARGLPLSLPPVLDRERLAVPNPSPAKAATWELTTKKKDEEEEAKQNEDTVVSVGTHPSSENIIPCVFNSALKIEDEGVHTSFEVSCAHLWQRSTTARGRPSFEPTFLWSLLIVAPV